MDRPLPLKPLPPTPSTDNPVVAVARKVKAVLGSQQQPSVRIVRGSTPYLPQTTAAQDYAPTTGQAKSESRFGGVRSRIGAVLQSVTGRENQWAPENEYDQDTVDLLDIIDPEVATLSTLTNVQNSLFVPSLGKIVDRQPQYKLSTAYREPSTIERLKASLKALAGQETTTEDGEPPARPLFGRRRPEPPPTQFQYAVLPKGESVEGWTTAQKEDLDDRVRHMLHSRRSKIKRSLKGFLQYVRRPFGLFITVYATLITLFGAAWVLFLIGWISVGSKKDYVVNVVDNVLVALFAIIGDGLAPFRAVDTYHMIYIVHYHRKTHKRRRKSGLPALVDQNDLPDQRKEEVRPDGADLESLVARKMPRRLARFVAPRLPQTFSRRLLTRNKTNDNTSYEYTVLTPEEQSKLEYHERKFSKSHTFYKPHETETHYAFPIKLLMAIVLLLDCHSALQISLGACTWGIPYKNRPFALTTVILCFSITCNIMGGVLISQGDKRTRKVEVIERMMRQDLTADAMHAMETERLKEMEERGELDPTVRKRKEEEREQKQNEDVKKAWKGVPLLPKNLLGKGEDHRQPALPQKQRGSRTNLPASEGASTPGKGKSKSSVNLPAVREGVVGQGSRSNVGIPPARMGEQPNKQGLGQKVLKAVRRADLDRS